MIHSRLLILPWYVYGKNIWLALTSNYIIDLRCHHFTNILPLIFLNNWLKVQIIDNCKSEINQVGVLKLNLFWPVLTVCCSTGEFVQGTITKNNRVGSIKKDDNGQRARQHFALSTHVIKMTGSVNLPNILSRNFLALITILLWQHFVTFEIDQQK